MKIKLCDCKQHAQGVSGVWWISGGSLSPLWTLSPGTLDPRVTLSSTQPTLERRAGLGEGDRGACDFIHLSRMTAYESLSRTSAKDRRVQSVP